MKLSEKIQSLKKQGEEIRLCFEPLFFRLSDKKDAAHFEELLLSNPKITLFDELNEQVEELVKSQNPKRKFSKTDLSNAAKDHLGDAKHEEYGVWVYFPWSSRIVHILDEKEFVDVRTNRNQHKITLQEREILSRQKIGVIGLSVGQSVSLTMAMERSFGEIRLADFDILELTNLNRIRTGIHHLGVPKVVAVAREIAEIDPYLKITCFPEGLNEKNIDLFFTEGGKLDIVIDECDGLDIKILCRQKARSLRIPVVMDASDRGTLDVERFDLEPERSILHGFIDHLDVSKVKHLKTNEEKIPYILPMLGTNTISTRLKASMMEIEQSITTWPQLSSAVVLGGALVADVCRRISLNQYHDSGRYFIDLEELVADKNNSILKKTDALYAPFPALTFDDMKSITAKARLQKERDQLSLDREKIHELIDAAVLAPSGGNSQPWKWFYSSGNLFLFHEKSRSMSFGDFEDFASFVGLGAAIENLSLKAQSLGMNIKIDEFPIADDKRLIARVCFFKLTETEKKSSPEIDPTLIDFISTRFTNRKIGPRVSLAPEKYDALKKVAHTIPGAELKIFHSDEELVLLAEIISTCEKLRLMHKQGHHDFFVKEIRWSKEENHQKKDGIDIATVDLKPSEIVGLQLAKDWKVIEHLKEWKLGGVFEKLSRNAVNAASAIGFLTLPEYSPSNFLSAGRAVQRVWLTANKHNISFQPLLAPMLLFNRLVHGNGIEMDPDLKNEAKKLRERFKKLVSLKNDKHAEAFLFRLCIADTPNVISLRLPINELLFFDN